MADPFEAAFVLIKLATDAPACGKRLAELKAAEDRVAAAQERLGAAERAFDARQEESKREREKAERSLAEKFGIVQAAESEMRVREERCAEIELENPRPRPAFVDREFSGFGSITREPPR